MPARWQHEESGLAGKRATIYHYLPPDEVLASALVTVFAPFMRHVEMTAYGRDTDIVLREVLALTRWLDRGGAPPDPPHRETAVGASPRSSPPHGASAAEPSSGRWEDGLAAVLDDVMLRARAPR